MSAGPAPAHTPSAPAAVASAPTRYFSLRHDKYEEWASLFAPFSSLTTGGASNAAADQLTTITLPVKAYNKAFDAKRALGFLSAAAASNGSCIGFYSVNGTYKYSAVVHVTGVKGATAGPAQDSKQAKTSSPAFEMELQPLLVFPIGRGSAPYFSQTCYAVSQS
jgi:hypothetical protein